MQDCWLQGCQWLWSHVFPVLIKHLRYFQDVSPCDQHLIHHNVGIQCRNHALCNYDFTYWWKFQSWVPHTQDAFTPVSILSKIKRFQKSFHNTDTMVVPNFCLWRALTKWQSIQKGPYSPCTTLFKIWPIIYKSMVDAVQKITLTWMGSSWPFFFLPRTGLPDRLLALHKSSRQQQRLSHQTLSPQNCRFVRIL